MNQEQQTNTPSEYMIPEELKKLTTAYPIADIKMVPAALVEVPDLVSGGMRKRKFGMVLSMAIIPNLDQEEDPLLLVSNMPSMFFDADTVDLLAERVQAELKGMVKVAKSNIEKNNDARAEKTDQTIH